MTNTMIEKGGYIEAVGRRKTAAARVRISKSKTKKGHIVVNTKPYTEFFKTEELQMVVAEPFTKVELESGFDVSARVLGGGQHAQAEAIRHGISRALVDFNAELRKDLKKEGFLKRDPRAKERRKFGLKKARKSPQWSKR
jgi:small subunit ribosomal protein S9